MGEFFRGWRRKIGVVTLLMACVFMAAWVRTRSIRDNFHIRIGTKSSYFLESRNGSLVFSGVHSKDEWGGDIPFWMSFDRSSKIFDDGEATWDLKWWIDGYLSGQNDDEKGMSLTVPDWLLVFPLTLISAFLLLSKPRQSNQKKIDEPASNEGA